MNDYIDRQAAIEALGERPVVWDEWTDEYTLGQRKQYDYDKLAIEALPSAEVEPVKHGRWTDCGLHGDYFPHHEWECSSCHECVIDTDRPWYAYCPSCGARMDLEGEDHEQD